MKVFVTGATGFVGSAVSQELIKAGHHVVGLARSDANAKALTAAGIEVFRGSLDDLEGLERAAAASDGVIHTAHNHDFVNVSREVAAKEDVAAVEAMGSALAGTMRPLVVTAGMQGRNEDDEGDGGPPRTASDKATLALASRGVRSSIVRLPPTVHGDGDHGFVPMLISVARARGVSAYIEAGQNLWPAVHRLDAAVVYRLALEKGVAGTRYHAVAEQGVPTKDIAEAIGRGLKLKVVSVPQAEAAAHFGFLGHFFARDVGATSTKTREQLGWGPTNIGLIEDLDRGTYFT